MRKNRCWARALWCGKTAAGRGSGGAKKPLLAEGWWYDKTNARQESGGAERPLLGEGLVMRENYDSTIWLVQSATV